MKKGFTLLEMIVSIVILGVLSAGTFVSLQHLYLRSAKSKAISELSLESQVIADQISALMFDRIPISVIGYNPANNTFESIYTVDANFTVLEWIGIASESMKQGSYSGFVDMNASNGIQQRISTLTALNQEHISDTLSAKFGGVHSIASDSVRLVFAGSFDDGTVYYSNEFNTTFGWHGNAATKIWQIASMNNDGNITLTNKSDEIYEKYYLVDSAYAVARGSEVNLLTCTNDDLNITTSANTLFLFHNFRPWRGETFCGDTGTSGTKSGNVTVLSSNVLGFEAGVMNGSIYFNITMNKVIRGSDNNVTISKQKAVY